MRGLIWVIIVCMFLAAEPDPAYAASAAGTIHNTNVKIAVNGQLLDLVNKPVIKNDRVLITAADVLGSLGADLKWYSGSQQIKVTKDDKVVIMKIGQMNYKINGRVEKMDVEPILYNGKTMIPLSFLAMAINTQVKWDAKNNMVLVGDIPESGIIDGYDDKKEFTVVIDAGHGGADPGAVYNGVKEKDLNIDIAKRLQELLKEEGVNVIMTRESDIYIDLYKRSGTANNLEADLLVSIHNNASTNSSVSGTMTLYNPEGDNSRGNLSAARFASIVQSQLIEDLEGKNLGVIKRPNLAVLRTADMPAVIAEIGYMSNKQEIGKLKTGEYRQKCAESLEKAILKALDEI